MRIAQVAPLYVAVPPKQYGGTERCIFNLTEALVNLGHEVTLFASGDSQTHAHLIAPVPEALGFSPDVDARAYHTAMLQEIYRRADRFDIIHAHLDFYPLPFAAHSPTPTVTTLHGRLDKPEFGRVYRTFRDHNYVAISQSQASHLPDINWVGMVHHGIDVRSFPYFPHHGQYLAFVGRISQEKRPDRAIEVAKRAGIPLKIAAKIDPSDREYYEKEIKPLLDHPLIEFIGEIDEEQKHALMGNALAVLMPIDWPEPFGMVYIEALACGTPVITCPCGSVPEIMIDNVTGYIRRTVDEMVEAVGMIRDQIDRAACRRHVEQHFSQEEMARGYLRIFNKLARQQGVLRKIIDLAPVERLDDHAALAPLPMLTFSEKSDTLDHITTQEQVPLIQKPKRLKSLSLTSEIEIPLDFAIQGDERHIQVSGSPEMHSDDI